MKLEDFEITQWNTKETMEELINYILTKQALPDDFITACKTTIAPENLGIFNEYLALFTKDLKDMLNKNQLLESADFNISSLTKSYYSSLVDIGESTSTFHFSDYASAGAEASFSLNLWFVKYHGSQRASENLGFDKDYMLPALEFLNNLKTQKIKSGIWEAF